MSCDPVLLPEGLNYYSYVSNKPTHLVDPNGTHGTEPYHGYEIDKADDAGLMVAGEAQKLHRIANLGAGLGASLGFAAILAPTAMQYAVANPTKSSAVVNFLVGLMDDNPVGSVDIPASPFDDAGRATRKLFLKIFNKFKDYLYKGAFPKAYFIRQLKFPRGIPSIEGARLAKSIRNSIRIGDFPEGNIGISESFIEGRGRELLVSWSRKAAPEGTIAAPASRIFETFDKGYITTAFHSEAQLLEHLAEGLSTNARGIISLYTERPPCDTSCKKVIEQFRNRFKGVELHITYGKPSQKRQQVNLK